MLLGLEARTALVSDSWVWKPHMMVMMVVMMVMGVMVMMVV